MDVDSYTKMLKGTPIEGVEDAAKNIHALSEDCTTSQQDFSLIPMVRSGDRLLPAKAIPVSCCCPAAVMVKAYTDFFSAISGVEGFVVKERKSFL